MHRRNSLVACVLMVVTILLFSTSSLLGQYGSPTTVSRTVKAKFNLYDVEIGPQFNGKMGVEVTPVAVDLPVWARREPGSVQNWNDILGWTWQNGGVDWFGVTYRINKLVYDFTAGDGSSTIFTYDLGTKEFKPFYSDIVSGFLERGPTERSLDIPWSVPLNVHGVLDGDGVGVGEVSFSALVRYNVFIEGGRNVYLDQDAKILSLNVGLGSSLLIDDNHSLVVDNVVNNSGAIRKIGPGLWTWNAPLNNSGALDIYGGVVELGSGSTFHNGVVSTTDGAILRLDSDLNLSGVNAFNGLGTVYVGSEGGMHLQNDAVVHGGAPIVINGGQLSGEGLNSLFAWDTNVQFRSGSVGGGQGVEVAGTFDWSGGSIGGTLFNTGNGFVMSDSHEKRIEPSSTLVNMGTIQQREDSEVIMCGFHGAWGAWPSLIENKYGSTYDLSGNGDILLGLAQTIDGPIPANSAYNVISNEGTFRKSDGTGESVIEPTFYNVGMAEVNSGTLTLKGGGQFTDCSVLVGEGATFRLESSFGVDGSNTFAGKGVIDIPSGGRLGLGTATTVNGSVNIRLDGGQLLGQGLDSLFAADTNIQLLSGSAGGTAGLSVAGSFDWLGGNIGGTLFNTGNDFVIRGTDDKRIASSTLTNAGTIRQIGDSSLAMCGFRGVWGAYPSLIENKYGSTYDLWGDGDILLGSAQTINGPIPANPAYNVISNEGTFRKSAGIGESVIEATFNNTGMVEVNSGTLILQRGGQFTNCSVLVSEGASLRLASFIGIDGRNTFNGPGTIDIPSAGRLGLGTATTVAGNGSIVLDGGQLSGQGLDSLFAADTNIQLISGSVGGDGGVAIAGTLDWTGGQIIGSLFNAGDGFVISGPDEKQIKYSGPIPTGEQGTATLTNLGTIRQVGDSSVTMWAGYSYGWRSAVLDNRDGATYDLTGDGSILSTHTARTNIDNAGLFRKSGGTGESVIEPVFTNSGTVEVASGTLAFTGGFTQTAGLTSLNGGDLKSTTRFNILGGMLQGTGDIEADILNQAGLLSPGFSPGLLTIDGDYTQGPNGKLLLEIGGWQPGEYDVVTVTGAAHLDGQLDISLLNGFRPELGDTFDVLYYGLYSGGFSSINTLNFGGGYFGVDYLSDRITLEVEAVPAPSALLLSGIGLVIAGYRLRKSQTS